jgi:hypothetical protein
VSRFTDWLERLLGDPGGRLRYARERAMVQAAEERAALRKGVPVSNDEEYGFRWFTFSYEYDGATWTFELPARDMVDAAHRLKAIGRSAVLDGRVEAIIDRETP